MAPESTNAAARTAWAPTCESGDSGPRDRVGVTETNPERLTYSPYDHELRMAPHATWRRLRDERPLYHNAELDFWALSRFHDVKTCLLDWRRFSSAQGTELETIKRGDPVRPGNLTFEDPPLHHAHRQLLAKLFGPRAIAALEPDLRKACVAALEARARPDELDFAAELGVALSLRAIELLLGIPEDIAARLRRYLVPALEDPSGARSTLPGLSFGISEYVGWRLSHPSDDAISRLAAATIVDETNRTRRLSQPEVSTLAWLIAIAGNETTGKLIGWVGYCLARAPEQRHRLLEDPALVPSALEEVLRFQSPLGAVARHLTEEMILHGHHLPRGAAVLLLLGAANRDDRVFPDSERLDVGRRPNPHVAFGHGIHFCLGATLARLIGRVALEEVLRRFPEWDLREEGLVWDRAHVARGWHRMPASV